MGVKDVFIMRLRDKLYSYLRDGPLKGWDVSQIVDFADSVIAENREKIDAYLKNKKVTLQNINESIEEILKDVLIPSIVIE
jgi:hypothetical protein